MKKHVKLLAALLCLLLLSAWGLSRWLGEKKNSTLYILMYHHFVEGDGSDCNDWTLPVSRLREDLQWLSDHGYTTVLPSQLAAGEPLPERAVMITLDDGYESNYRLAYPVLRELRAKAVISLIVHHIEDGDPDWLTWDMCREMAGSGLVEIGSHTYKAHADGTDLQLLPGESQADYEARIFPDVQSSIDMIQKNLGTAPLFFAYPHGNTCQWSDNFLAERFAVTVTTRHGPANISRGLYQLPRHNISMSADVSKYLPA